jgi:O-antigen ligase
VVFFLWQVVGLLFAESFSTGIERLVKRISFLLFPLVLFYPGSGIKKNIKMILRLFAISTFLYLLYCFGIALNHSLTVEDHKWIFQPHPPVYFWENYFYGERLSFRVHPSYLSMYIIIALIIVLETLFDKTVSLLLKLISAIVIVVFIVALYLLSARAGMLAGILILPAYIFLKFYRSIPKLVLFLALVSIFFLLVTVAKNNFRVKNSIENLSAQPIDSTLKSDARLLIWQSAIGVIEKNLVLGVGTGDATNSLTEEFLARGYSTGFYDNLNAHNQFLEILLENGLIGFILFLLIIVCMIRISISQRNLLLALFIFSTVIFFLFETMMNRLAGITFFSLFSFLLIYYGEMPVKVE